ncbi:MAG: hypothetical protein ABH879_10715 [archaeon]
MRLRDILFVMGVGFAGSVAISKALPDFIVSSVHADVPASDTAGDDPPDPDYVRQHVYTADLALKAATSATEEGDLEKAMEKLQVAEESCQIALEADPGHVAGNGVLEQTLINRYELTRKDADLMRAVNHLVDAVNTLDRKNAKIRLINLIKWYIGNSCEPAAHHDIAGAVANINPIATLGGSGNVNYGVYLCVQADAAIQNAASALPDSSCLRPFYEARLLYLNAAEAFEPSPLRKRTIAELAGRITGIDMATGNTGELGRVAESEGTITAYFNLAVAAETHNQQEEALDAYARIVNLGSFGVTPGEEDAYFAAVTRRAEHFLQTDIDKALAVLKGAYGVDSYRAAELQLDFADQLYGRDPGLAVSIYLDMIDNVPGSLDMGVFRKVASFYLESGRDQEALGLLASVTPRFERQDWLNLIGLYDAAGRFDEALAAADEAIGVFGDAMQYSRGAVLQNRAFAMLDSLGGAEDPQKAVARDLLTQALEAYGKVGQNDPAYEPARSQMGRIHRELFFSGPAK